MAKSNWMSFVLVLVVLIYELYPKSCGFSWIVSARMVVLPLGYELFLKFFASLYSLEYFPFHNFKILCDVCLPSVHLKMRTFSTLKIINLQTARWVVKISLSSKTMNFERCLRSSEGNLNWRKKKNWEMKNTQAIKWNLLSGQNPFCNNERWKENCVA